MADRTDFQTILEELLGSENVYFQPPPTVQMIYPCIVYRINDRPTRYADDLPYINRTQYLVTSITKDPDSDIPKKLTQLKTSRFDRRFTADNLNHEVFSIFF